MISQEINVIILEDDVDYAEALKGAASRHPDFKRIKSWVHLQSLSETLEHLSNNPSHARDVIVTDLGLPGSHRLEIFQQLHTQYPEIPIVILTAAVDDSLSCQAIQTGAQDFLMKGKVDGAVLMHSIASAFERNKIDRSKADFVSLVAHDMSLPIMLIQAALSSLKDKALGELTEKQMAAVQTIDANTASLNKIAANILEFSKNSAKSSTS